MYFLIHCNKYLFLLPSRMSLSKIFLVRNMFPLWKFPWYYLCPAWKSHWILLNQFVQLGTLQSLPIWQCEKIWSSFPFEKITQVSWFGSRMVWYLPGMFLIYISLPERREHSFSVWLHVLILFLFLIYINHPLALLPLLLTIMLLPLPLMLLPTLLLLLLPLLLLVMPRRWCWCCCRCRSCQRCCHCCCCCCCHCRWCWRCYSCCCRHRCCNQLSCHQHQCRQLCWGRCCRHRHRCCCHQHRCCWCCCHWHCCHCLWRCYHCRLVESRKEFSFSACVLSATHLYYSSFKSVYSMMEQDLQFGVVFQWHSIDPIPHSDSTVGGRELQAICIDPIPHLWSFQRIVNPGFSTAPCDLCHSRPLSSSSITDQSQLVTTHHYAAKSWSTVVTTVPCANLIN